jgi:hypothetical protein
MYDRAWITFATTPIPVDDPTWTETWGFWIALAAGIISLVSLGYARVQTKHAKASAIAAEESNRLAAVAVDIAREQSRIAQQTVEQAQIQSERAGQSVEQARVQSQYAADQLELAKQLREEQAQPYLLVEIDSSRREAQLLVLRVSNAGMTSAHEIKALISPALTTDSGEQVPEIEISTLAPGGVFELPIDTTHGYFKKDLPRQFTVSVEGRGLFGPVRSEPYLIDLDQLAPKLILDTEGVLITKALRKIETHLKGLNDASAWWKLRQKRRDDDRN